MNTLVYMLMIIPFIAMVKGNEAKKSEKWLMISILTLIGYIVAYVWKHPFFYGPL